MGKVTLVYDCLLSEKNGANTVIRQLINNSYLENKGIYVKSLSPDDWGWTGVNQGGANRKKTVKKHIKSLLLLLTRYSSIATAIYLYFVSRVSKKISNEYIKSNPPSNEVVFFHTLYPCYYYLKQRKTNQPTVLVMHTSGDTFKMFRTYYRTLDGSLYYKWLLKMEKYVLKRVDRINFVAEKSAQYFLELHPYVNPSKVSFIYNGVPNIKQLERATLNTDRMEFCCVASVSERKGQKYIVEALKEFKNERIPNVHFTIVGDGPDRNILEEDVKKSGLEKFISFVGVSLNVDEYLYRSDAYILVSEDEGLPMAIIEAMRASLPIVSTPVGGIPEMVEHGENGLLIQPCTNEVYNLLNHLNDYNWKEMGNKARQTFEDKFTTEKMLEGYSKLLSFEG